MVIKDRRPKISDGMRALVKKLAAYTRDVHNQGTIGPKRVKQTILVIDLTKPN